MNRTPVKSNFNISTVQQFYAQPWTQNFPVAQSTHSSGNSIFQFGNLSFEMFATDCVPIKNKLENIQLQSLCCSRVDFRSNQFNFTVNSSKLAEKKMKTKFVTCWHSNKLGYDALVCIKLFATLHSSNLQI